MTRRKRHQRNRKHMGESRALDHGGKQRGVIEHACLRKIEAVGVAPGAVHQPGNEELRNIDQHQRHQDFIGIEAGAKCGWDGGPRHATCHAGKRKQWQEDGGFERAVERQRSPACSDGARNVLALCANVPYIGAKAHRKADRDQHQGCGLQEELGDALKIFERKQEEHAHRVNRVFAERGEDQKA